MMTRYAFPIQLILIEDLPGASAACARLKQQIIFP
jgi:hypothetical protein